MGLLIWGKGLVVQSRSVLSARRYASAGLCESNVPSVRHTKASVMISLPSGSPTILVF